MTSSPTASDVVPPNAFETEQGLIGAILQNADVLERALEHVTANDFCDPVHQHIFRVMCERRDAGELINLLMMNAALGNADIGGTTVRAYLIKLFSESTTVSGATDYARMIAHAARMRRVFEISKAAAAEMTAGSVSNPTAYAGAMIEALDEVASAGLSESARRVSLSDGVASVLARVDQTRRGEGILGTPYGIPRLDNATLGMRPGQFIVLAGRPGMGKTAVALHVALEAARHGGALGLISLEMNAEELSERVLSAVAYNPREWDTITYRGIAEARGLSEAAIARLREAQEVCVHLPIWIEQQPGLTLSQIAARGRQMKAKAERLGIPFVALVVDHIGLIRPSKRHSNNRVQEMTEITVGLKGLAKDLGIPVLGLSQLNREVEKRSDKRPQLSDLRDSGSIEQDADVVLGLFRESYYLERQTNRTDVEEDRLARTINTLEIEILKQRSGPTIRIECFCDIACNVLAEAR